MELYEHQKQVGGKIASSFLCVHMDTHGRAFENKEEIEKYLSESKYEFEIKPISEDSDGNINVFYLIVYSDNGFEFFYDDFDKADYCYSNLNCVKYYEVIPCNLNLIE